MSFNLQLPSSGGSSNPAPVVTTVSSATTGSLTFLPSTFSTDYVYINLIAQTGNTDTLYLTFNGDTTAAHYSITHGLVNNTGGQATLGFSSGNGIPLNGADLQNGDGNPETNYFILVSVSGTTTSYIIVGEYINAVPSRAQVYFAGTYNAAATSINTKTTNAFSGTITSIKIS